jgi:hypothetical protein
MKYPASHLTPFLPTFPGKPTCKRIESAKNFARAPAIRYLPLKSTLTKKPGGGGTSFRRFSPHSFTPIFEGPPVYPDLRGATLRFRRHMRLIHPEWIYGMRHAAPLSPVASVDCAYFLSPRGCTPTSGPFLISPVGAYLLSVRSVPLSQKLPP